jgi:TolA-binding protein
MDCGRVAREEVLENYLLGRLSEEDRDAFEEHYFECGRCFEDLQMLRTISGELRGAGAEFEATRRRPFIHWVPAAGLAAAAVLAVGTMLWMQRSTPADLPEPQNSRAASPQPRPDVPLPERTAPADAAAPSIEELARFEPPRYEPLKLRGIPDEATARFQRGMEHYRHADYAAAVDQLRAAAEIDADAPHALFFLGISHLLLGQDSAAIDRLRATVALGDSSFLEEAHFHLAKALLRQRNVSAAEAQLKAVIQLRGSRSDEARRLLTQVEKLKGRQN